MRALAAALRRGHPGRRPGARAGTVLAVRRSDQKADLPGPGDLGRAERCWQSRRRASTRRLVAYVATYWDLYWVLSAEQRDLVKRLAVRPSTETLGPGLGAGRCLRGRGRHAAGRGLRRFRPGSRSSSSSTPCPRTRSATSCSGWRWRTPVGRRSDRRKAEGHTAAGVVRGPVRTYSDTAGARIYILVGDAEKALDHARAAAPMPYFLSPGGFGSIRPSIRCGSTRGSSGSWSGNHEGQSFRPQRQDRHSGRIGDPHRDIPPRQAPRRRVGRFHYTPSAATDAVVFPQVKCLPALAASTAHRRRPPPAPGCNPPEPGRRSRRPGHHRSCRPSSRRACCSLAAGTVQAAGQPPEREPAGHGSRRRAQDVRPVADRALPSPAERLRRDRHPAGV